VATTIDSKSLFGVIVVVHSVGCLLIIVTSCQGLEHDLVFIEDLLLRSCPGSADSPVNLKMLEDSTFLATTGTRADHLGLLTKLLCSLATKFRFEVDLFVGRAFLFGIQVMCAVMTNMANKLMTSLWLASVRTTSSKLSSRFIFGVTAISIVFKDWSKLNIRSPQTKPTGCYEFNSYAFRCSLVL
jgi:hypothetical protein